eukprot:660137-Amphidinium_carterae.2
MQRFCHASTDHLSMLFRCVCNPEVTWRAALPLAIQESLGSEGVLSNVIKDLDSETSRERTGRGFSPALLALPHSPCYRSLGLIIPSNDAPFISPLLFEGLGVIL